MAQEKIISPGVFTRENDLSFLAQGIANIGGAIVGPFPKGPAFAPTLVKTQADLEQIFGIPDGQFYGPYTAQQYLEHQGTVTIVRVGGLGGYLQKDPLIIYATPGTTDRELASGSFIGRAIGLVSGSGLISASIKGRFSDGPLSGSLVVLGDVTGSLTGVLTDVSGSVLTASINLPLVSGQLSGSIVSGSISSSILGNGQLYYTVTAKAVGYYGPLLPATFVGSGTGDVVLAVLANTAFDSAQILEGFDGSTIAPASASVVGSDFKLTLKEVDYSTTNTGNSSSYGTINFSLNPGSPSFITNVFGTNPLSGQTPVPVGFQKHVAYIYKYFPTEIDRIVGEMLADGKWEVHVSSSDGVVFDDDLLTFVDDFSMDFTDGVPGGGGGVDDAAKSAFDIRQAETPWINSQLMNGTRYQLFKVHTLADGTDTNTSYKIVIGDVKLAGTVPGSDFGSFSLTVRAFDDTDQRPTVLENYQNLTLDPDSANFVARRIGDRYIDINFHGKILEFGDFPNKSKTIRIEMTEAPYPDAAVPYGFDAYSTPIGSEFAEELPAMTFTSASIYSRNIGKYASGIVFQPAPAGADTELASLYPLGTKHGAEIDNRQYFSPIPEGATTGNNVLFDLESFCGISPVLDLALESDRVKQRKFALGFQQGFSGQSPSIPVLVGDAILPENTQGLNCKDIKSSGSVAYKQALTALGNADEFDINLLVTPGIIYSLHSFVAQLGVTTCEDRGDCFNILDLIENQPAGGRSIGNIVDKAQDFDTNYAAAYYPWVKILDTNTNRLVTVPPTVVIPAVYAQNDKVAAEWFAPAGLNRGGISKAIQVVDRLTHDERDQLYDGRVNPIATFPGQGIVVWGQKTLQVKPSALDRINVRRLLIALKKFIASTSRYLVFEQNVATTRNRFLSIVNPYLESVQQRSGLYAFKVVMDDTNNTPDLIDRNILVGDIYLQPAKAVEFIILNFNVLPTGAVFPTA